MEMEAFVRKACKAVGERLGSGFRVEARDVRKNNGVILHGMSVMKKGQNVAPTIYLDTFLEAYESGPSCRGSYRYVKRARPERAWTWASSGRSRR
jgi:hypothetical protein